MLQVISNFQLFTKSEILPLIYNDKNNSDSFGLQDMPSSREQPSDHGSFSFHFDDLSGGNRKSEEKVCYIKKFMSLDTYAGMPVHYMLYPF